MVSSTSTPPYVCRQFCTVRIFADGKKSKLPRDSSLFELRHIPTYPQRRPASSCVSLRFPLPFRPTRTGKEAETCCPAIYFPRPELAFDTRCRKLQKYCTQLLGDRAVVCITTQHGLVETHPVQRALHHGGQHLASPPARTPSGSSEHLFVVLFSRCHDSAPLTT